MKFKKLISVVITGMLAVSAMSVTAFADGTDITISTIEELEDFRDAVNSGTTYEGQTVTLTEDIDLSQIESWTPIGTSSNQFKGTFDGGNHTISNLTIKGNVNYYDNSTSYVGLFGYIKNGGSIKNLTIENADVTGCLYVGAVLGRMYIGSSIENCHLTGDIDIEGYWYVGGIAGRAEYLSKIDNCSVKAEGAGYIEADCDADTNIDEDGSYAGGIVGFTTEPNPVVSITGCSVENINISGVTRLGGISGIAHEGNIFTNNTVTNVTIKAIQNENQVSDSDAKTIGLIAGACQGSASQPATFTNNTIIRSKAYINDTEVTSVYGTNINGSEAVTNYGVQWLADTDAGYYDNNGTKSGLMRFLFAVDIDDENVETGIKFVKGQDITEQVGNIVSGTSKAFYGDIMDVPESASGNTYYAMAYVTVNPDTDEEQTYWSSVSGCTPSFERYFGTIEQ